MTDIPRCPTCGSHSWSRELRPEVESWTETIKWDCASGSPVYRSTWIDPGTGLPWQTNIVPGDWSCIEGHVLDPENTIVFDLEELTYELEVRG